MNTIVTGGCGFIGSHLTEQLLKDGHKVTVIDNLSTGRLLNIEHLKGHKDLSFLKADKTALIYPHSWILGADTIVVVQDQILGKPKSKTQAFEMLNNLNNCEHSVYTGFCLLNQKQGITIKQSVETNVFFKSLSTSEINWYINTGEPFDKAGAYAIQGIGAFLIHRICGSYSNVVGLPVCEVIQKLMELNIIQFKDKDHHVIHQN